MSEKIFFIFAALLFLQSIASLRDGYRFLRYFRASLRTEPGNYAPLAAVIIPVKGIEPGLELNLSKYLEQDYPAYQLIFVVVGERDPALAVLKPLVTKFQNVPGARVKPALSVAGTSDVRGEKVNNLLAGLAAVARETEVMIFADADARPGRDWLRSLVAPLADPTITVSTGFRWYLPGEGFVSRLRAAWDTSVATLLGEDRKNFAWGGSMAMRAADFRRLQIAEQYWQHTVSDDYAVTRAVRDARGKIRFEPRCLMASREDSTFRGFMSWANRQIILTRVYAVDLWRLGLAAHLLYCGTVLYGLILIVALPWSDRLIVAGNLAGILLLGLAKGRIRAIVAREKFPEEQTALERRGSCYWTLTPLVPWVMFFNFVRAGLTRRIEWRGTRYELVSHDEVRVLGRKEL
ncbi:MAG TPA: glycosyltransferase [Terriglobia bacterium]|nr:glycosyltransferase [Terriglobia bacterium]